MTDKSSSCVVRRITLKNINLIANKYEVLALQLILWIRLLLQKIVISLLIKKQPHILLISEVRLCAYKSPPLVRVQSPVNPIDIFPSYLSKVRFNIILPFAVGADSDVKRGYFMRNYCFS